MPHGFSRLIGKIHSINVRYRNPRIGMSPAVRSSLMALRVYLLVLVALMLFKFVTLVAS
ncbi:MAG TPA: hypothetical protein VEI05_03685 [Burkholderiaceae bacterium]|nr:hypothetical protein [Burkholderiaceae bacterium]